MMDEEFEPFLKYGDGSYRIFISACYSHPHGRKGGKFDSPGIYISGENYCENDAYLSMKEVTHLIKWLQAVKKDMKENMDG